MITPRFLSEWKDRSKVSGDVVFFPYASLDNCKKNKEVFVFDLDKTYLDTTIDSLKGLVNTAIEKAFQKKNVPGTASLVRALKRSWETKYGDNLPLFFITASPPQLEKKILEKLTIDGVKPFGIFCKDNLQNVHPKRMWRLTQQVGFKLQALLQLRILLGNEVKQILFGDDSESDAIIYSLYSDFCSRRLSEEEIKRILKSFRVVGSQMNTIIDLLRKVPIQDPVSKIYINLAIDTDSEYYLKFGRRTVPTYNSFQTALDLFQSGHLEREGVVRVGHDLQENFGFSKDELSNHLDDMIRRRVIGKESLESLLEDLQKNLLVSSHFTPSIEPVCLNCSEDGEAESSEYEPWVPEVIDYLHDYR